MTIIERLDPTDDAQFAEFHDAYLAGNDGTWDRPYTFDEQRAEVLDTGGYQLPFILIARNDSGAAVGTASAYLPLKDNPTMAYVGIRVVPGHRRQGHGTACLEAVTMVAQDNGRTKLFAEAHWDAGVDAPGNRAFAERHGFRLDLIYAHRVLELPATLAAAPARDGYAVRAWRDACPEAYLDEYANLLVLITQEAPSGDAGLENEFFDAARVRSDEALLVRQGRQMQVVVAVAPDGTLAGHSQLVFPMTDRENVYQWDTLVLEDHRGHGLGLALKTAAMYEASDLLDGRRWIHTYNAASNGPMIAVNEAMGFRLVAYNGEFVRTI